MAEQHVNPSDPYGKTVPNQMAQIARHYAGNASEPPGNLMRGPFQGPNMAAMVAPAHQGYAGESPLMTVLQERSRIIQLARIFTSEAKERQLIGPGGICPLEMTKFVSFRIEEHKMNVVLPVAYGLHGPTIMGSSEKSGRTVVLTTYAIGLSIALRTLDAAVPEALMLIFAQVDQLQAGVRDHLMLLALNECLQRSNKQQEPYKAAVKDLTGSNNLKALDFFSNSQIIPGFLQRFAKAPAERLMEHFSTLLKLVGARVNRLMCGPDGGRFLRWGVKSYIEINEGGMGAPDTIKMDNEAAIKSRLGEGFQLYVIDPIVINGRETHRTLDHTRYETGEFARMSGFGHCPDKCYKTCYSDIELLDADTDDWATLRWADVLRHSGRWGNHESDLEGPRPTPKPDDYVRDLSKLGANAKHLSGHSNEHFQDSFHDADGHVHRVWGQQAAEHLPLNRVKDVCQSFLDNMGPLTEMYKNNQLTAAAQALREAKRAMENVSPDDLGYYARKYVDQNGPDFRNVQLPKIPADDNKSWQLPPGGASGPMFRAIRDAVYGASDNLKEYAIDYAAAKKVATAYETIEQFARQVYTAFPNSAVVNPAYAPKGVRNATHVDVMIPYLLGGFGDAVEVASSASSERAATSEIKSSLVDSSSAYSAVVAIEGASYLGDEIRRPLIAHLNSLNPANAEQSVSTFLGLIGQEAFGSQLLAALDTGRVARGFDAKQCAAQLSSTDFAAKIVSAGIAKPGMTSRAIASQINKASKQVGAGLQSIGETIVLPLYARRSSGYGGFDTELVANLPFMSASTSVGIGARIGGAIVSPSMVDPELQDAVNSKPFTSRYNLINQRFTDPILRFVALAFIFSTLHWGTIEAWLENNVCVPLTAVIIRSRINIRTSSMVMLLDGNQRTLVAAPLNTTGTDMQAQRSEATSTYNAGAITIDLTCKAFADHVLFTGYFGGMDLTIATGGQNGSIVHSRNVANIAPESSDANLITRGSITISLEPAEVKAHNDSMYGKMISTTGSFELYEAHQNSATFPVSFADAKHSHFYNRLWFDTWYNRWEYPQQMSSDGSGYDESNYAQQIAGIGSSANYLLHRAAYRTYNAQAGSMELTGKPTGVFTAQIYRPGMVTAWKECKPYPCLT